MTRKLLSVLLAALLMLMPLGALAETVEIDFPTMWVGVNSNKEWFDNRMAAFNEAYGDSIKVNVEEIAGDQNYVDKMKVLYSSNSLPDAFNCGGYNLIDSMKDQLVDLTDIVAGDPELRALANDLCWEVNSRDGRIYGVPDTRHSCICCWKTNKARRN